MSALPPKADIAEGDWHVRFVPKADILRCSKKRRYSNYLGGGGDPQFRSYYEVLSSTALGREPPKKPGYDLRIAIGNPV